MCRRGNDSREATRILIDQCQLKNVVNVEKGIGGFSSRLTAKQSAAPLYKAQQRPPPSYTIAALGEAKLRGRSVPLRISLTVRGGRAGRPPSTTPMPLLASDSRTSAEIATQVAEAVDLEPMADKPELAGPGFLNVRLRDHQI